MNRRDIVVIGASAGGVAALEGLLGSLPPGLPASVFIAQHRASSAGAPYDMLVHVLGRVCPLPVLAAAEAQLFQTGRVYLAPPGHHLIIENGVTRLEPSPRENFHRPSIDLLFRSAASVYGRRTIGIVLSGIASDGTAGLWQIKKRGGVAMVQEPSEAEHPNMLLSAIREVQVDYVAPVARLAQLLGEITRELDESGERVKVLIVEDERIVAANLEARLEERGYQVTGSTASGEDAVALAEHLRPDIVLMDIRLGGKVSGIEAARAIWDRVQVPVVYLTAYSDRDTLQAAATTENYGYVVKPFHAEAVHAAIQMALARRDRETR
jgi:chemotaxis response regulator CheB